MSEFPRVNGFPDPLVSISPISPHAFGGGAFLSGAFGSAVYPAANVALFYPFRIARPLTFTTLYVFNGTAVSGNIDVGVYSHDGTLIVSKGSTAQAGASTLQTFTVPATELDTGLFYMAVVMDNITGTLNRFVPSQAPFLSFFGMAQMASAFPLPPTATLSSITNAFLPYVGLATRSVL